MRDCASGPSGSVSGHHIDWSERAVSLPPCCASERAIAPRVYAGLPLCSSGSLPMWRTLRSSGTNHPAPLRRVNVVSVSDYYGCSATRPSRR
jgi:hypothetical protein